jgi:hypothetical protein
VFLAVERKRGDGWWHRVHQLFQGLSPEEESDRVDRLDLLLTGGYMFFVLEPTLAVAEGRNHIVGLLQGNTSLGFPEGLAQ